MAPLDQSNKGAQGVPYYTPEQDPPAGTALEPATAPTLYKPIKIRSVELHNRLVVAPMCMYSAEDGHLSDFHLVHAGQFALHGAGLTIIEATAVEPRGRITPQDSGLWKDSQIPILRRITDFMHSQGTKAGIQLAHAGRKASTLAPWITGSVNKSLAEKEFGGWPDDVVAPSSIPYEPDWAMPKALTVAEIKDQVKKWVESAERAVKAGFDVIEIHAAHGYLNTEFLSPITNVSALVTTNR
jgi:2,4-dienoyl-CoA reductase-like NADH-dependent reductase (Old Yellow Enzyme family)